MASPDQQSEIGRELRVSELEPRTIVFLHKVGTNIAVTMWVVEIGDVYVHFHAGAAKLAPTEFYAVRCGDNLEEVTDDAHNRLKIFEYLGEP
jgi:hypothetical protein